MSSPLTSMLSKILEQATGHATGPLQFRPLGGGSINETYKCVTSDSRAWFCKINDATRFPDLFRCEKEGLELLRAQNIFRVPSVIACEVLEEKQILVLEWIEPGPVKRSGLIASSISSAPSTPSGPSDFIASSISSVPSTSSGPSDLIASSISSAPSTPAGPSDLIASSTSSAQPASPGPAADHTAFTSQPPSTDAPSFWQTFGRQLAELHKVSSDHFGLESNNFMGSLPQSNHPGPDWVDFFIQHRLEPQLRLAIGKKLMPAAAAARFGRLYKALPEIFPEERPSLLHGDCWSGNYLCDRQNRPVLIDPAVYYGHRSIDLAMTTLFGGFAQEFYEAYDYHFPFPVNYRRQWEICNLYPLLIHLNIFGESYLAGILRTIQPF